MRAVFVTGGSGFLGGALLDALWRARRRRPRAGPVRGRGSDGRRPRRHARPRRPGRSRRADRRHARSRAGRARGRRLLRRLGRAGRAAPGRTWTAAARCCRRPGRPACPAGPDVHRAGRARRPSAGLRGRVLAVPGPVRGGVRGDQGRGRAADAGGEHAELATVAVRPRLVWGRGDTGLLPRLAAAVRSGRLRWVDGGEHLTSTTHVRNAVEGVLAAADRGRGGEAYFVTDGAPVPFREFATELLATRGIVPDVGSVSGRVARAAAGGTGAVWRTLRLPGGPPVDLATVRVDRRGVHAAGRPGPAGAWLRGPRRPRAGAGRATVGVQPGRGLAARPAPGGVSPSPRRAVTATAPGPHDPPGAGRPGCPTRRCRRSTRRSRRGRGEGPRLAACDLFVRRTPGPAGGGEPALYVHGLGGASTNWTDYAALLATRLDGEALDLPGFGESGPAVPGGYAVQEQARTVIAYLDQRGGRARAPGRQLDRRGRLAAGGGGAAGPGPHADAGLAGDALAAAAAELGLRHADAAAARHRPVRPAPAGRAAAGAAGGRGDADLLRRPDAWCRATGSTRRSPRWPGARSCPGSGDAFTASLRGLARVVPGARAALAVAAGGLDRAPTLVVWGAEDRLVPVELAARTAARGAGLPAAGAAQRRPRRAAGGARRRRPGRPSR